MSDQCRHVREQIRTLEQQVDLLQQKLQSTSGTLRMALLYFLKRTQGELAEKREDLRECEAAAQPPLSDPRVFGSEITQGIPEYQLVAGKDTLVRVFVGAKQPVVLAVAAGDLDQEGLSLPQGFHFDVPLYGSSRLDFATLHVMGPGGLDFELPAQMSGVFSNFSKSLSEKDNVNFYVPGRCLARVGSYRFLARFYRDGILVGTNQLGTRRFDGTKDLRLLITVDTFPMPLEAWSTLFGALKLLQRNLPVRSGIAPMDSDLSAGLRFYVDPVPFDPDWPAWGPVAQRLTGFNQQQAADGKPDRADNVMTVRTQQPGEGALGGTAQTPGKISGVVLNVNPPGDGYFAALLSHEIGHNFNLGHEQALAISTASAFDLLNRKSLPEPRNIMFSPVGTSETSLLGSDDWNTVRNGLLQLDSTGPA